MRTTYCLPTLKKITPYDLSIEQVHTNTFQKPYVIPVYGSTSETIEEAYLKAAHLRKDEVEGYDSICIELKSDIYRIKNTVLFNKEIKNGLPIIFSAQKNVSLYGSIRVFGNWEPYKNGIYRTYVEADNFRQLYVNGKSATRARFPKKNSDCGKEVFEGKWLDETKQIFLPDTFRDVIKHFDSQNMEVHIIEAWTHSVIKPAGYAYAKNGFSVNLSSICRDRFYEPRSSKIPKPKVWIENGLSLLTAPNEWFYDSENHMLYYYPEDKKTINALHFEIPQVQTLFEIENSQNIRFENIEFAYSNWNSPSEIGFVDGQGVSRLDEIDSVAAWRTPPAALNIKNSDGIHFTNCRVHGTGAMGVKYDGACNDIHIRRNRFYDIGAGAISVGSFVVENPFVSPVSKNIVIADNFIKNFGQSYLGGVGILVGYSQNVEVDHNDVSYGNYTGISIGWGWGLETPMCNCKIRNNRVTHIIENHLYDGAGLYILGRHLTDTQNVVRGNYLEGGHGYAGFYFDEKANNYIAVNNYIGRGRKWFLLMHDIDYSLHDIVIKQNFIETTKKHINSYSPNHAYKPKTKKERNIKFCGNITRIHPQWATNKARIFNHSGVRKDT